MILEKSVGLFARRCLRVKSHKSVGKLNGIEGLQIVDGLSDADEVNGQRIVGTHLSNRDKHPAFGGAVQLRDDETRQTDGCIKLISLNPNYKPIKVKYSYELRVIGKVVG